MMNRLTPGSGAGVSNAQTNSSHGTSELTGRKKVTLAPGHSLMDWIRLGRTEGDLSGVGATKRPVTLQELTQHNQATDIWMAIRGKVYNLTPYMDYHPGGTDELMRAAGKDGTDLFDEIHNWVNIESMLEKCFIGHLKGLSTASKTSVSLPPKLTALTKTSQESLPSLVIGDKPTIDFYQNDKTATVVIYTKMATISHENVIVDNRSKELLVEVSLRENSFFVHVNPHQPLSGACKVSVVKGKVDISLDKKQTGTNWSSLGKPLKLHQELLPTKSIESRFSSWTCLSNTEVTHDTRLLAFQAPKGQLHMHTPVGRHIVIRHSVSGMEISRSYTVAKPSLKPLEENSDKDTVIYLMIKKYVGGAISPWITGVKPGEKADISCHYYGNFDVAILAKVSHLVFFAAGTGFTSMISVIHHTLHKMSKSLLPVKLVFFNKTVNDILWKKELNALAESIPRFSVHHVLSQEPDSSKWAGLRGRVSESHMDKFVAKPSDKINPLMLVCGPWGFNDQTESLAKKHGLSSEQIYIFTQKN